LSEPGAADEARDATLETTVSSVSPEETRLLAEKLVRGNPAQSSYYLEGDLGAGKTVFTKGLAEALGVDPKLVSSPTFALVNRYSGGERVLYHLDLYRIERERELEELGIEELEEEGAVLVVEWAEKLGRHRRSDATVIRFEVTGESERRIRVREPARREIDGS
jgi:tRNA threonylcarbamoyladenosine biosynthesis protein TsaE